MSAQPKARYEVLADPAALSHRVADWLLDMAIAKDDGDVMHVMDMTRGSGAKVLGIMTK